MHASRTAKGSNASALCTVVGFRASRTRIERSSIVSGRRPMAATTLGAQVENMRGSFASPSERIVKAVSRVWPALRTPRSSSAILRKVSASSMSSVGFHASTERKSAEVVMLPLRRGLRAEVAQDDHSG